MADTWPMMHHSNGYELHVATQLSPVVPYEYSTAWALGDGQAHLILPTNI